MWNTVVLKTPLTLLLSHPGLGPAMAELKGGCEQHLNFTRAKGIVSAGTSIKQHQEVMQEYIFMV